MAAVGTWAFSLAAVETMRNLLAGGSGATDCVQQAMAELENDKETGCYLVARGGFPNKAGVVQCDAAIMEGLPGRFGAVAALPGVGVPLTVARMVMDKNAHNMLVGEGAVAFAKEQGFSIEDNSDMMTAESLAAYEEFLENRKSSSKNHDTLGLIALDRLGNVTAGVSTSGAPFKDPGRVGDSPLPGCGLYADNRASIFYNLILSHSITISTCDSCYSYRQELLLPLEMEITSCVSVLVSMLFSS
uniref:N(4)-(Beta-N-acetylglucosaminyl)-L-asparaginase isoform X3 n=1 Tax=Pristiophorus japonicus TaxID=55135 RepID=UPI00398F07FC